MECSNEASSTKFGVMSLDVLLKEELPPLMCLLDVPEILTQT